MRALRRRRRGRRGGGDGRVPGAGRGRRARGRVAIERYLGEAARLDHVAAVTSPFEDPARVSDDGTIAFATIDVDPGAGEADFEKSASQLQERAGPGGPLAEAGVRTGLDGDWYWEDDVPASEAVGLLVAAVVLFVSFGSVVAMGLPLVTALIGVAAAVAAAAAGVSVRTAPCRVGSLPLQPNVAYHRHLLAGLVAGRPLVGPVSVVAVRWPRGNERAAHHCSSTTGGRMGTRARFRRAALAAAAAAGIAVTVVPAAAASTTLAGSPPAEAQGAPPAATTYIVTLESGAGDVAATARTQLRRHHSGSPRPRRVFRSALHGYTATMTPDQAAALADDPAVAAVEPDTPVTLADTQTNAPWALDRIDQPALPLSGTYTYTRVGEPVWAYVIDTGIRTSHAEVAGHTVSGYDAVDGGAADDCNGHGTHVASTIGGATYGVAKRAPLIAMRVLNCGGNGSASGVIAAIDWAVAHHPAGQPAVANMSLGGTPSNALDAAIGRLIADGVTVVAAAGNSGADACGTSPARVPAVLTVAASTSADGFASFSNRGPCVDIIAPGAAITGAWSTSDTATATVSGTSMASPHVTGVAIKVIEAAPGRSPGDVTAEVLRGATPDRITGVPPGTPNRLLFTNT